MVFPFWVNDKKIENMTSFLLLTLVVRTLSYCVTLYSVERKLGNITVYNIEPLLIQGLKIIFYSLYSENRVLNIFSLFQS